MSDESSSALMAEKYPQGDLFICDVADAVLKDIMPQMEHPFYSLSKKPDTTVRRYEHNGNWLEITPSVKGLATIYDKDILIYCISQLIAKKQRGEEIGKRVKINTRELLMFSNRGTAGKDYRALVEAFDRLAGTTISTNIQVDETHEEYTIFNLIDAATIRRELGFNGRLESCAVTLSDWVISAINDNAVLTLHRDYFRLRKPIERRIYELARKHCGQQNKWQCRLSLLHKKTGSQSTEKEFRRKLKLITASDHLPDYTIALDTEADMVIFHNRNSMPKDREAKNKGAGQQSIHPDTFERVAALGLKQDKYVLEQEFRQWIGKQGIAPRDMDALFLEFCRGRVEY